MFTPSVNLRRSFRLAGLPARKPNMPSRNASRSRGRKKLKSSADTKSDAKESGAKALRLYDAILIDIEGTTTPISFVHDVLFPYVNKALDSYLETNFSSESLQHDIAALKRQAMLDLDKGAPQIPDSSDQKACIEAVAANVRWQMASDQKTTALKSLQGHIWTHGYESGVFKGEVFEDVGPCLHEWASAGFGLYVYSSGSIEAQRLLFGHSTAGDLVGIFSGFFDTTTGSKRERESYSKISRTIGCSPERVLFLTDIYGEAEAAMGAGMKTIILKRPGLSL